MAKRKTSAAEAKQHKPIYDLAAIYAQLTLLPPAIPKYGRCPCGSNISIPGLEICTCPRCGSVPRSKIDLSVKPC